MKVVMVRINNSGNYLCHMGSVVEWTHIEGILLSHGFSNAMKPNIVHYMVLWFLSLLYFNVKNILNQSHWSFGSFPHDWMIYL